MQIEPRKRIIRPKPSEILYTPEGVDDSIQELKSLWTERKDEILADSLDSVAEIEEDPNSYHKILPSNLTHYLASFRVLNQVFNQPIVSVDVEQRILQGVQRSKEFRNLKARMKSSKTGVNSYLFASWATQAFPEDRLAFQPSDKVLSDWIQNINTHKQLTKEFKIDLLGALAVLRPDKIPQFRQLYIEWGGKELWETRLKELKDLSPSMVDALKASRILFPELSLTPQEKKRIMIEFTRLVTLGGVEGFAAVAILFASQVEIDSTGKILAMRSKSKFQGSLPLPERLQT